MSKLCRPPITVGNIRIIALLDMIPPAYDPAFFFEDVTAIEWAPYRNAHLDKTGKVQLYYGCFALISNNDVILIDTGIGKGPHSNKGNLTGNLIEELQKWDISQNDVSLVVHTHLHADHIGWNLTRDAKNVYPTFPKARYMVTRKDWEYFTTPEALSNFPFIGESALPLETLGILDVIPEDHVITSEISTVSTPGHTPGHVAIYVNSGGETGVVIGDILHSKVQVQEPRWCVKPDVDKPAAIRSRIEMLDAWESQGTIVAAGHFHPKECFGKVIKDKDSYYWKSDILVK